MSGNETEIQTSIEKISSFIQDVRYRSLMVNSASYNVRLLRDRKSRLPFLDSQTGIAQNPCKLYLSARHRMPGIGYGQIYMYPSHRWQRRRRSYLAYAHEACVDEEATEHTIVTVENPTIPGIVQEDSNASFDNKPDQFFYDLSAITEDFEELDDDDVDDDTYTGRVSKRKKKKEVKKVCKAVRGRKKKESVVTIPVDIEEENPEKPYECHCLSYHLSHTHRPGGSEKTSGARSNSSQSATFSQSTSLSHSAVASVGSVSEPAHVPVFSYQQQHLPSLHQTYSQPVNMHTGLTDFQDSYIGYLSNTLNQTGQCASQRLPSISHRMGGGQNKASISYHSNDSKLGEAKNSSSTSSCGMEKSYSSKLEAQQRELRRTIRENRPRAVPNSYCDFCLGDSTLNKRSGQPEDMISCADCGRCGHPTCLQFTSRMMQAVRQYSWQCIECKCCTTCGTTENDEQLLFCDDCDRGYHLYCLQPPLTEPPEGEWSCSLCQLIKN